MKVTGAKANFAFPNSNRVITLFQLLAACITAFAIVCFLTPFGAAVSPDSILYLDIATHIHNGQGVTGTDYALAHAGENRAVPNTIWPPLYPALLALATTQPGTASAAIWSAVLLAATLFFTQRILCRILSWPLAALAALPLALAVPMLTIHTYAWSEQLFVAVLVALLLATQRYLAAVDRRSIALVAVLLVLAFYTRYIGLLFFPLLPLLYVLSGRPRQLRTTFWLTGMACGIAVAALLIYNFNVSGSVTGTTRQVAHTSLLEQLRSLVSALVPLFHSPGRIVLVTLLAFGATAVLWYVLSAHHVPQRAQRKHTAQLALGIGLYYLACIVALRSLIGFDEIDVRLIGVVVPYLWIGGVALIAGFEPRPAKALPALLAALVVTALVANGCFAMFAARKNWQVAGSPWFRINATSAYNNFNLPPIANLNRKFMAARTNADSVLVADQPQEFRYTTGLASFDLPTGFSAVELQKLASFPARSYIVLTTEQRAAFEAALLQHGVRPPQVSVAGDTVLLHLPLELNAVGN